MSDTPSWASIPPLKRFGQTLTEDAVRHLLPGTLLRLYSNDPWFEMADGEPREGDILRFTGKITATGAGLHLEVARLDGGAYPGGGWTYRLFQFVAEPAAGVIQRGGFNSALEALMDAGCAAVQKAFTEGFAFGRWDGVGQYDEEELARGIDDIAVLECWHDGHRPHFDTAVRAALSQAIEQCAIAAEAQDRAGHEWVRNSLWANILKRAGANVRALLGKGA